MVTINGKSYSGKNVTINNGNILIDGKPVGNDASTPHVYITLQGNIDSLQVDSCNSLRVEGDCGTIKSNAGDITISGNVSGDVKTMSGDVRCGNVSGSISSMSGDVKYSK
jgi:DUF4097 and DUF4098 domain-containing protein YvlB